MARQKAKRRPVTLNRYLGKLHQHLNDTHLISGYAAPPFTPEEIAQARFNASEIHKSLRVDETDAVNRIAVLTCIEAYRMQVWGNIRYLTDLQAQEKAGKMAPPATPPDEAVMPTDQQPESEEAANGTT